MNRIKLHVRKGDQVEVIAGNHKGSTGKVLEVLARKQRVLVEGVRMIKKHMRKSQDNPQGQIAEREGPIHISNVKVVERGDRNGKDKGKAAKSAEKPKAADKPKAAAKKTSSRKKATKEEA
jgi:large subunit ribosomal protein L24